MLACFPQGKLAALCWGQKHEFGKGANGFTRKAYVKYSFSSQRNQTCTRLEYEENESFTLTCCVKSFASVPGTFWMLKLETFFFFLFFPNSQARNFSQKGGKARPQAGLAPLFHQERRSVQCSFRLHHPIRIQLVAFTCAVITLWATAGAWKEPTQKSPSGFISNSCKCPQLWCSSAPRSPSSIPVKVAFPQAACVLRTLFLPCISSATSPPPHCSRKPGLLFHWLGNRGIKSSHFTEAAHARTDVSSIVLMELRSSYEDTYFWQFNRETTTTPAVVALLVILIRKKRLHLLLRCVLCALWDLSSTQRVRSTPCVAVTRDLHLERVQLVLGNHHLKSKQITKWVLLWPVLAARGTLDII